MKNLTAKNAKTISDYAILMGNDKPKMEKQGLSGVLSAIQRAAEVGLFRWYSDEGILTPKIRADLKKLGYVINYRPAYMLKYVVCW